MANALTVGYYITQTTAILLNSAGLYLLMKHCNYLRNHDLTIANLSIAEILMSLIYFTFTVTEIHFTEFRIVYERALDVVAYSVNFAWLLAMFLITLDRFFAINFPFRYKVKATGYRMRLVIMALWTSSTIICVIFYFVEITKKYFMAQKYLWFTLDAIFVLTFVISYGTIYAKFRKSAGRFGSNPATNPASRRNVDVNKQFLLVVGLIFVTYILLVIVPEIIVSIFYREDVGYLLLQINYIMDPLIYIFMRKDLRKRLNISFYCLKKVGHGDVGNNVYTIARANVRENRNERERRMDVKNTKL
eukprot:Seg3362.2 transcript_id=Seg3362.2/GoldUCD/mRNA.D3Y31 product="Melanocortin receptor 4" protein_id=Seg3362.2/GoldUCD/D3Y31